jgi:hypothetical protein
MLLNDTANGRKKKNCKFRLCFCKSVQGDFVREISSLTTAMQILRGDEKISSYSNLKHLSPQATSCHFSLRFHKEYE